MALLNFANNRERESLASRLRQNRLKSFLTLTRSCDKSRVSVIDLGGAEKFWERMWNEECERLEIVLLNLTRPEVSGRFPITSLDGDARDLSRFDSGSFDFCFSNSVIEHVGTLSDQTRMAAEIGRVAKGYFIQTPFRYFPLEPHFHFPFWAQLPSWTRTELHRRWNLGWYPAEPDRFLARADVEQVRLLSLWEYRRMFPDADICLEKIGPLVKSMMAIRAYSSPSSPAYDHGNTTMMRSIQEQKSLV